MLVLCTVCSAKSQCPRATEVALNTVLSAVTAFGPALLILVVDLAYCPITLGEIQQMSSMLPGCSHDLTKNGS